VKTVLSLTACIIFSRFLVHCSVSLLQHLHYVPHISFSHSIVELSCKDHIYTVVWKLGNPEFSSSSIICSVTKKYCIRLYICFSQLCFHKVWHPIYCYTSFVHRLLFPSRISLPYKPANYQPFLRPLQLRLLIVTVRDGYTAIVIQKPYPYQEGWKKTVIRYSVRLLYIVFWLYYTDPYSVIP